MPGQLLKDAGQHHLSNLLTVREGVAAVHQVLRLDDRKQVRLLAQTGTAGQVQGANVCLDAGRAGLAWPSHREQPGPFCKARAHRGVGLQALAQPVQPLGDLRAGMGSKACGNRVHLDADAQACIAGKPRDGLAV